MVQGNTEKVQSAAPVHRRPGHIEGEAGDGGVHEDTKVITKVGSGHAKSPHAGENQDRTNSEQDTTDDGLVHGGVEGLVCQSELVDMVTEDSKGENGERKEVATIVRTSEDAGQEVVAIFC